MVTSQPRYAHTIFCDDVRQEITGKHIIIGVYSSEMSIFGTPPITLPRLLILVQAMSAIDDPIQRLKIRASGPPLGPDSHEAVIPEVPLPTPIHGRPLVAAGISASFDFSPCVIHSEGFIEVTAETERETMWAGRLYVRIQPLPEAAQS
ncbi:hypothetical protein [Azospirillum canadense]|uniref:hypothetical protein n=1 Tax=Azospirillum canadense TaxID=403962 RepID=UPI002227E847|nr:hypothetical protein [Azospirillum canadense]MCW2242773.1 hypothetical protein [Azospirillum canadense]